MISVDDVETNTKFAQSLDTDFPLLSDPGKRVAEAYGVVNDERPVPFRWTFVIGPEGKILRIDKEVSRASAGANLVTHLTQLNVTMK